MALVFSDRVREGEAGMREDKEAVGGMREAREIFREGEAAVRSSSTSPGCFNLHELRFSSLSTWSFKNRYLYFGELRMAFTM